ncbi:WD40-repeat-containing domain protein [Pyronema domesticum]|uniref:Similar to Uncharacterized WD repeat-containing protein C17D11.16 acc. no. Q9P775 n=1 Tax=Pyronema omphalodes (strain CBS 100304) TaxID=1076935 RepID=U4KUX9_PYROM|nr:WD40-repeat-containing domain protein [Pyronema domesticum]CCX04631.1 Similar to Uncharacterized WD repeat-containing protein C17D11.16; acc. no. Q9P775 [Pyronema omphalodes CBS 100304]
MSETMITCTTWVPRGFAAENPRMAQLDDAEMERISALAKLKLEDAQGDLEDAEAGNDDDEEAEEEDDAMEVEEKETTAPGGSGAPVAEKKSKKDDEDKDDDLAEYNLDDYDEPTEEEKQMGTTMGMFGNVKALAYYSHGEEDPYITMAPQDMEDEEREEFQIMPTDNLLLVGKVEDDIAHLEIYVYEDSEDNLYVHNDIMLPAIPLCLEWLDVPVNSGLITPESRGNVVAIGTTEPDIEIWDLDVVDSMYPNAILGAGNDETAMKKSKKKKKPAANDQYHVGAVQALAGNRQHRNLLASASADKTVKLWDLTTLQCAKSYNYHTDQVCALAWNPSQSTTLLSGSYDRTVVWADMRTPDAKQPRWGVESDVEAIRWDPHDNNYFYVSTESGCVHFFDSRVQPTTPAQTKPVWTLQAHDKAVSSFDINPIIPGFLATASVDKSVKLWNTQASTGGPSMVVSRDMDLGKIFSVGFAPDKEVGFRLSVAGDKGVASVWDTSTNAGVRRVFGDRVAVTNPDKEDRLVRAAANDDEESDSDDEEDVEEEEGDGNVKDGWESMDDE